MTKRKSLISGNIIAVPTVVTRLDPESTATGAPHDAIVDECLSIRYSALGTDPVAILGLVPNNLAAATARFSTRSSEAIRG